MANEMSGEMRGEYEAWLETIGNQDQEADMATDEIPDQILDELDRIFEHECCCPDCGRVDCEHTCGEGAGEDRCPLCDDPRCAGELGCAAGVLRGE